jgi:3-keto-5-aminohexanoate cleavage enzyme
VQSSKFVIVAALTGGTQQDRDGAKVPTTPEEISEAAYRCHQAGAAVVHIHARDEKKQATGDVKIFEDIIRRIRAKCDVLIQITNGIGSRKDPITGALIRPSEDDRLALFRIEPRPDLYSIAGGSWDFYHPGVPGYNEFSFANTTDFLRRWIPKVMQTGGALEFEIVEASHIQKIRRLADDGIFDARGGRFWLDLCFGFGGQPSTAKALAYTYEEAKRHFPKAPLQVLATGKEQIPMATVGMLMGCDIARVGFEDSLYLPNGEIAVHNHDQVDAMASLARQFGREPATVADARHVFGIGN